MRNEGTNEPRVSEAARKVSEGLGELGRALNDRREGIVEPIAELIQERPLVALTLAFGVGYVLGGGLFSRATGRALGLGWRLGGVAIAKNLFGSLAGAGQEL